MPFSKKAKRELSDAYTQFAITNFPVDTGRKLNVHKTFRRRPGRLLNVLCTFNLRPVSTGLDFLLTSVQNCKSDTISATIRITTQEGKT